MEFNLKFNMDNAAFSDYPEGEISSILRKVIKGKLFKKVELS
jgi:hypothetical protein